MNVETPATGPCSPMTYWVLGLTVLLIAVGRFLIPGHDLSWAGTYEAMAHIAIGWMLGVWWAKREPVYLWAVGGLTVLEVIMALTRG